MRWTIGRGGGCNSTILGMDGGGSDPLRICNATAISEGSGVGGLLPSAAAIATARGWYTCCVRSSFSSWCTYRFCEGVSTPCSFLRPSPSSVRCRAKRVSASSASSHSRVKSSHAHTIEPERPLPPRQWMASVLLSLMWTARLRNATNCAIVGGVWSCTSNAMTAPDVKAS